MFTECSHWASKRWPNVGHVMFQRHRRWPSTWPTFGLRFLSIKTSGYPVPFLTACFHALGSDEGEEIGVIIMIMQAVFCAFSPEHSDCPASTMPSPNAGLIVGQRCRPWTNFNNMLVEYSVSRCVPSDLEALFDSHLSKNSWVFRFVRPKRNAVNWEQHSCRKFRNSLSQRNHLVWQSDSRTKFTI